MSGTLVAVCAVHEIIDGHSRAGRTAIDKRPIDGEVRIDFLGVVGDTQCDRVSHGGRDKALYAYSREEADRWAQELGREIAPGSFGENLAVRGMPVTDAVVGERWRIGSTVVVETTLPRVPCQTFKWWMGEQRWVKRFSDRGDVGSYLRVITPGSVRAGDPIEVLSRPEHGVTIREVYTARQQDPARLQRLLDEADDLAAGAELKVRLALDAMIHTP